MKRSPSLFQLSTLIQDTLFTVATQNAILQSLDKTVSKLGSDTGKMAGVKVAGESLLLAPESLCKETDQGAGTGSSWRYDRWA